MAELPRSARSDGMEYALRLLSYRNYFTAELADAVLERYPDADIAAITSELTAERYLDDERQFRALVRWRAESGYGPYWIRDKLRAKGLAKSISEIEEAALAEDVDFAQILAEQYAKYVRTKGNKIKKDVAGFMRSCIAYLMRRGFSSSDCINIVKEEVGHESNFFEGC